MTHPRPTVPAPALESPLMSGPALMSDLLGAGNVVLPPGRSVYEWIAEHLTELIISGALPAGARVPTAQQLIDHYQISRPTARQALAALRRTGLIATRSGYPSRVARPQTPVLVGLRPRDLVTSRLPTGRERRDLDLREGIPLLVVRHETGVETHYPAHATTLTAPLRQSGPTRPEAPANHVAMSL